MDVRVSLRPSLPASQIWGHDVTAINVDEETVARLNDGETSIHEPGLEPLLSAIFGYANSYRKNRGAAGQ